MRKHTHTVTRASLSALVALALLTMGGAYVYTQQSPAEAATPGSREALENMSDVFAEISEMASQAVVYIEVEKDLSNMRTPQRFGPRDFFERFFGPDDPHHRNLPQPRTPRGRVPVGQGTGFIVSSDGYIITNHHVVGEADLITVKMNDGREFEAEVIGSDPLTEVALIKVDAKALPSIELGDSDRLRVGEWVLAIGNPFGLSHTVTAGIVSATGRGNVGITDYADFIQTDAAINPGNSGGPLLNLDGEVVGLNTAIYSRSGGYMGIGFAVPINMVKYIQNQLLEDGKISRGFLGVLIQNLDATMGEHFGAEKGILVADVSDDSPAEKAGLERDDIIIEYDGQEVEEVGSFRSRVSTTKPGSKVSIVVLRDGERKEMTVTIGTLDEEDRPVVAKAGPDQSQVDLGFTVQNLTDDLAEQLGFSGMNGVVVSDVEPGSPAARARIENGNLITEVNRQPVKNTREFNAAISNREGRSTLLLLHDGEFSRYVALEHE